MKKINKILTVILALFMVALLFTACGKDMQTDEKNEETTVTEPQMLTGKDLLIGDWKIDAPQIGMSVMLSYMHVTFNEDGTWIQTISEDNYNYLVNQEVDRIVSNLTDEDISDKGFSSREEAKEYYKKDYDSYEDAAAGYAETGTWELDGDTLILKGEGSTSTVETKLSEGVTTIKLAGKNGEATLTKLN
ncbi:MAG: hypothetical protein IKK37_01705 [Clostridia bacterium]|nr:hypothetical protein [Clostridia bacterium]